MAELATTLVSKAEDQDHVGDAVPLSERRPPVTMGLLWITMVTGFPSVLVGFQWYKNNLVFSQIAWSLGLSVCILLLYAVPACYMGAQTGLTYSLLSRRLFGVWGSRLVSLSLILLSMGWYGLTAFLMADGLRGLFHLSIDVAWLAAGFGIIMAFNNFFGFSGIANFAGYIAAPVLVAWVGFAFFKCAHTLDLPTLTAAPIAPFSTALTLVSAFVLGYGAWGNEQDFWRYGKPKMSLVVIPLVVASAIGLVIFPITGWLIARISGITDFAEAAAFMNSYSFFGLAPIAALVLFVTYFALADSCLYGSINGVENLKKLPRRVVVGSLTLFGAVLAAVFSHSARAFEDVAAVSSIVLPCASVVMIAEGYVVPRYFKKLKPIDLSHVPSFAELERLNCPSVTAMLLGSIVGIGTCGVVPGLETIHVGVSALQAWLTTLVSYLLLRSLQTRKRAAL